MVSRFVETEEGAEVMFAGVTMTFLKVLHVTAYAGYGTWVVTAVPLSYPEDKCWFRYSRWLILRILLYCSWGILLCNWCVPQQAAMLSWYEC